MASIAEAPSAKAVVLRVETRAQRSYLVNHLLPGQLAECPDYYADFKEQAMASLPGPLAAGESETAEVLTRALANARLAHRVEHLLALQELLNSTEDLVASTRAAEPGLRATTSYSVPETAEWGVAGVVRFEYHLSFSRFERLRLATEAMRKAREELESFAKGLPDVRR